MPLNCPTECNIELHLAVGSQILFQEQWKSAAGCQSTPFPFSADLKANWVLLSNFSRILLSAGGYSPEGCLYKKPQNEMQNKNTQQQRKQGLWPVHTRAEDNISFTLKG